MTPTTGKVFDGSGMVWENLTRGLPVLNTTDWADSNCI